MSRLKSSKAEVAVICGSGLEKLIAGTQQQVPRTPYGDAAPVVIRKLEGTKVAYLPRHGASHSVPPHKINYRANIYALHMLGVRRILATNAVGAINIRFKRADFVVPHDFVDFTKARPSTFFDEAPVTHVDLSVPYCPQLREALVGTARKLGLKAWDEAVLVCTEGPRLETPAEIRMFKSLGCDVVGMTGFPEVVLAKELGICYASVCYVSNLASGLQKRLVTEELVRVSEQIMPDLEKLLTETIIALRAKNRRTCRCTSDVRSARLV